MHESGEHALVPARGNRYSDDLWQLIYEIWTFEAGQNGSRTHFLLSEKIRESINPEFGEIEDESLNLPTVRQIQKKAKEEDWRSRALNDMARIAPKLWKEANLRIFTQLEAAQRFDQEVLDGVYDRFPSPGVLAIKEKVAARVQTLAAVGTAAGLMPPSLPTPEVKAVEGELSPQELGRRMREKLDQQRGRG